MIIRAFKSPIRNAIRFGMLVHRFFGERPAVGQYDRDEDIYAYLTFNELFESVKLFSSGLKKLVLDRGCSQSMVSMCSISRLEWYLTDLACLLLSIPTVSL